MDSFSQSCLACGSPVSGSPAARLCNTSQYIGTVNECEIQDSGLELSKSTPPLLSSNDLLSTQHDQETVARIHSEASNTLEERLALHVKFLQSSE